MRELSIGVLVANRKISLFAMVRTKVQSSYLNPLRWRRKNELLCVTANIRKIVHSVMVLIRVCQDLYIEAEMNHIVIS